MKHQFELHYSHGEIILKNRNDKFYPLIGLYYCFSCFLLEQFYEKGINNIIISDEVIPENKNHEETLIYKGEVHELDFFKNGELKYINSEGSANVVLCKSRMKRFFGITCPEKLFIYTC